MSRPKQSTRKPPKNWDTPIAQDIKRLEQIPPRTGRERLSRLEKLAMLDGIHHGLTDDQISAEHKMSTSTIQRFKRGLYDDPLSLFDMRVMCVASGSGRLVLAARSLTSTGSSSAMVTVPLLGEPMLWPGPGDRVSTTVSVPSLSASSIGVTMMDAEFCPARMTTVPDNA